MTLRTEVAGTAARRYRWIGFCSLALPLVLLQLAGPGTRLALRFDRDAIFAGQLWRVLTGHLLHLGWVHALLNLAGLALCLILAPSLFDSVLGLWRRFLTLALVVSLALLVFHPAIPDYVGLSGVLYGFFMLGLVPAARRDWVAAFCLLFILVRLVWQLENGASPAEGRLIGGHVVGVAHAYGVAGALLMLGWEKWRRRGKHAAAPADL